MTGGFNGWGFLVKLFWDGQEGRQGYDVALVGGVMYRVWQSKRGYDGRVINTQNDMGKTSTKEKEMKNSRLSIIVFLAMLASWLMASEPDLSIYNQDITAVREQMELNLISNVCSIQCSEITANLDPKSVILRDITDKSNIQILEQTYLSDPVSEGLFLSLSEGKTLDFLAGTNIVQGKVVRSGYTTRSLIPSRYTSGGVGQPIIEVDGKLRFGLPGTPMFSGLVDYIMPKPILQWIIKSDHVGKVNAELAYTTGGMQWEASYNIILSDQGNVLDIVGWVMIDNQTGRTFKDARVKLITGDINKTKQIEHYRSAFVSSRSAMYRPATLPASEKPADEYHLYTLPCRISLHDHDTKQVEYVRTIGVEPVCYYIYDGVLIDSQPYRGYDARSIRLEKEYGTNCSSKIRAIYEFENSEKNHLGIPLPKGRVRFYQRDSDGQLGFSGDSEIDHTSRNETVRLYPGNASDLTGQRQQANFMVDNSQKWLDETFEIKVTNNKKEEIETHVVEHLYRWNKWEIKEASNTYLKTDNQTIEFRLKVKPNEEKVITYTVHYTW